MKATESKSKVNVSEEVDGILRLVRDLSDMGIDVRTVTVGSCSATLTKQIQEDEKEDANQTHHRPKTYFERAAIIDSASNRSKL
jgi:hypothetical protein